MRGDVVLVPFPYSSLRTSKVRPAVIVSSPAFMESTGDVIVAMVTSQRREGSTDFRVRDWKLALLQHPSWIRSRLMTLSPALIRYQIGSLSPRDLSGMDTVLKRALGIGGFD